MTTSSPHWKFGGKNAFFSPNSTFLAQKTFFCQQYFLRKNSYFFSKNISVWPKKLFQPTIPFFRKKAFFSPLWHNLSVWWEKMDTLKLCLKVWLILTWIDFDLENIHSGEEFSPLTIGGDNPYLSPNTTFRHQINYSSHIHFLEEKSILFSKTKNLPKKPFMPTIPS